MVLSIIGIIIGIVIAAGGIYFLAKERADKESVKIYAVVAVVGVAVVAFSAWGLF